MKKILVVEDKPYHQEAARILLPDYDLTIKEDFDSAIDVLTEDGYARGKRQEFDIVLTDMLMPQGRGECMGNPDKWRQEEMPFGYPIVLIAAKEGVPFIGVVSDMSHHDHPLVYTLDFLTRDKRKISNGHYIESPPIRIENSMCRFFGDSSLHMLYMKDGNLITANKFSWDDFGKEPTRYAVHDNGKPIFYKNWKAALEKLFIK